MSEKELFELQEKVNHQVNKIRAIQHLIHGDRFRRAWENASIKPENITYKDLKQWMLKNLELEGLGIHVLKTIAKELRVYNYSRLSKDELIFEVNNAQRTSMGTVRKIIS